MRYPARFLSSSLLAALLCSAPAAAQSFAKARMLAEHGLLREAKKELIDVIFAADQEAATVARAHYLLGSIALDEGDVGAAHKRWTELTKTFPTSPEAKKVKKRLPRLAQALPAVSRSTIQDPVARSYLRNGDYWAHGRERGLPLRTTRLHRVEAALKWYDKVIEDFTKTPAAEAAAVAKIETLLAWRVIVPERKDDPAEAARFSQLAMTSFGKLAEDHPESTALQRLRYLIAESFRQERLYKEAEEWLLKVVKAAGKEGDFYGDLANRRLEKLKW